MPSWETNKTTFFIVISLIFYFLMILCIMIFVLHQLLFQKVMITMCCFLMSTQNFNGLFHFLQNIKFIPFFFHFVLTLKRKLKNILNVFNVTMTNNMINLCFINFANKMEHPLDSIVLTHPNKMEKWKAKFVS